MSEQIVVGHVDWSPDFRSSPIPSSVRKALEEGRIKLNPGKEGGLDVVVTRPDDSGPGSQEEPVDLRPHRKDKEIDITLLVGESLSPAVQFTYTNWKGETKTRRARLRRLYWGCNEWHPETQWLIVGFDLDKEAVRTYALKDISELSLL